MWRSAQCQTEVVTEVVSVPTDLRPTTGAGVSLAVLAAQTGAVLAAGLEYTGAVPDVPGTGVTLRGQDGRPGDLFAALPGLTTHGARYAGAALERGAVAVLTDADGAAEMASHAPAV